MSFGLTFTDILAQNTLQSNGLPHLQMGITVMEFEEDLCHGLPIKHAFSSPCALCYVQTEFY